MMDRDYGCPDRFAHEQDSRADWIAEMNEICQKLWECFNALAECIEDPDSPRCKRAKAKVERAIARERGEVLPFYVVAYKIHQCYGGPEEGGWWYDATEIAEVRKCWSAKQGIKAAHELKEDHAGNGRGRTSVLGDHDCYVVAHHSPEFFWEETTERPRYE